MVCNLSIEINIVKELFMMSFTDFLTLIKENTSNKLENYNVLCRFCLENHPNGIDIADENVKQQRDAILNDYTIVTKQYLSTSAEYPNFVCSLCKANLSQFAQFVQRIEQNAEYWEIFLKASSDVKVEKEEGIEIEVDVFKDNDQLNSIEEIKIEYCDGINVADVPDAETNVYDALEAYPLKIAAESSLPDDIESKRKRGTTEKKRLFFMNVSTEFERTCKLCDEPTFSSLARLYSHQKLNHPGTKNYGCDVCGALFISKNPLFTHMKDRHANCGKKHQCQFCARMFYSDREMKGHEKSHVNARSYVCNLCGKGFNQKPLLNAHLKSRAHNENFKTKKKQKQKHTKVYRCVQCVPSTLYSSSEERRNHRNVMHKIYDCEVCKNSFITLESLQSHQLLHSDKPRPFVCSVCNATFNQSSHLSSHFKRRHTDEKSFHCLHCDKSFFENCDLNSHANLVHNKQERVKCNECDSDFASIRYLQMHTLAKHSTQASPYDCKICGKRNGNGANLEKHRLKNH